MNPAIISDFRMLPGTLFFAYDILGYGLMALSTLFLALVVRPQNRRDRLMKVLLWMVRLFCTGHDSCRKIHKERRGSADGGQNAGRFARKGGMTYVGTCFGYSPEDSRQRILDTALEMFSRRVFDAVSVRDISFAVGVRESALYKHFKNKRAVFDSLNEVLAYDLDRTIQ